MLVTPNANLRRALLSPRSVVLVGNRTMPGKTAGRPLNICARQGFGGRIYCVNARRGTVLGERRLPSVAVLPEAPDHAYILVPTEAVIDAVAECGRAGVKVATILAAGFSETGADGVAREQRLAKSRPKPASGWSAPPASAWSTCANGMLLTANAAVCEPDIPGRAHLLLPPLRHHDRRTDVARQSTRRRLRGLVSIGNEVDLSIGDICAATLGRSRHRRLSAVSRKHPQFRCPARVRARGGGAPVWVTAKLSRRRRAAELVGDDRLAARAAPSANSRRAAELRMLSRNSR